MKGTASAKALWWYLTNGLMWLEGNPKRRVAKVDRVR